MESTTRLARAPKISERAPPTIADSRLAGEAVPGDDMKLFRVELKVCEGCGALWTRSAEEGVYCSACSRWLSEFPAVRVSRKPRSKRVRGVAVAGGTR